MMGILVVVESQNRDFLYRRY